ncbi:nuclease-related domain-containing protein [Streptomyces lonegramiae]|uniref:Nuclease-related domain-containing protein n=1 Tax=Streptomyces lonegramiae TaxID=3075524 RepID=A0ABU2XTS7_9ACTN|nr:nuclease-related domain-containing protein [Streptomyces sp. DSM 41529]MDT0549316.1 nuclease-related domain-containing protein [Streptomyces sp. DSM 41529]
MDGLRVSPWKRYGHDRLYVNLPGGEKVAWFDCGTGKLNVLVEEYRDAVVAVLAPYLAGTPSPTTSEAAAVDDGRDSLRPEDDLAANRPGTAVSAKLDELAPGIVARLVTMMLGRRSEAYGWRKGLVGERRVGAELERLTCKGWRVLHSIPLPRDVDIDHLLIGPGGVFSVNTKYHRGARVWVGDDSVKIGGQSYPYVRKSRAEARRASLALTRACGFAVDVRPVLAFVDVDTITVTPSLQDVRVVRDREFSSFKRLEGVWTPRQIGQVYGAARNRRSWLNA